MKCKRVGELLDVKRQPTETEAAYIWRLGQAKDNGVLDLTWPEIADLINKEFREDTSEYRSESAYRKKYTIAKEFAEGNVFGPVDNSSDIAQQIQKLQKERIKLSDARTDYNRLVRREARKESYADMVKRIICENVDPIKVELQGGTYYGHGDNDLLIHISDIHTGIEIHNWKNDFDEGILKKRLEKYVSEIIKIQERHYSENAFMVIGEVISGIIHNNLRLQNNMDMMEQFKYISELLSGILVELSEHFKQIFVYVTPGNHSRISPKKEDSLDGENMDVLLSFYLRARLQNYKNISVCENIIDPEIASFVIRGQKIFAAHGHKDSPQNVVQNFTLMFGMRPDIVLLGHRHTNGMTTVSDVKVIESGCCSGSDQFAVSIRKTNRPEQTVSVVNDNGLVCLYDIQLD